MLPVSRLSVILFPHGRKYSLRRSRIFKLNRNYCVPIKYAFSSPNKNETIREHTGIFGGVLVFCLRCDYIFYDDDDDGNDGSHSIHIFMCILNNCVVFRWLYVFRFGSFRSLVCTHGCAHVWCYKTHTLNYSQAIINGYEKKRNLSLIIVQFRSRKCRK